MPSSPTYAETESRASQYSGLLMNSRYFNHSVLIMTCILVQVCVRNIPASWRRGAQASVSWLRDTSVERQQTNQTIFQFIFHIYIKSTQNKHFKAESLHAALSPCSQFKMKIWIPTQDTMLGSIGVSWQIKLCLPLQSFVRCIEISGNIAFLIFRNIWQILS